MSGPSNDPTLWDYMTQWAQQWKPGWIGLVVLGVGKGLKMLWQDYKDKKNPDAKADRLDRAEAKAWLSQQDRRVRGVVEGTNAENARLLHRVEELEKDVADLETQVDNERRSGMSHYQRNVRLYDYIVQSVHDWRNGGMPPDKIPDMDKI
jgi:hypothetical protein